MKLTKKTKLIIPTLMSTLCGAIVAMGFAVGKDNAFKAKAEDVTYTLTLDDSNGKITVPTGQEYANSFTAQAKSKTDGHVETIEFGGSLLDESDDDKKLGKIMYDYTNWVGGNIYNITPINSIKSLTINYSPCDRFEDDYEVHFDICWSWDNCYDPSLEESNGGFYRAAYECYVDKSFAFDYHSKTFEFCNEMPNYFYISATWDSVEISSIVIDYSCTEVSEIPDYYTDFTYYSLFDLNDDENSYCVDEYIGKGIKEITVPDTFRGKPVTKLGTQAFDNKTDIEVVNLPDTIEEIGFQTFHGCSSLKTIDLSNTSIKYIGQNSFYESGLETLEIPDTVIEIGEQALGMTKLNSVVIPSSVHKMGENAFIGCSNLYKVYFRTISSLEVGSGIFENCPENFYLYFEDKEEDLSALISSSNTGGGSGVLAICNGAGTILAGYSKTYEEFLAR